MLLEFVILASQQYGEKEQAKVQGAWQEDKQELLEKILGESHQERVRQELKLRDY